MVLVLCNPSALNKTVGETHPETALLTINISSQRHDLLQSIRPFILNRTYWTISSLFQRFGAAYTRLHLFNTCIRIINVSVWLKTREYGINRGKYVLITTIRYLPYGLRLPLQIPSGTTSHHHKDGNSDFYSTSSGYAASIINTDMATSTHCALSSKYNK